MRTIDSYVKNYVQSNPVSQLRTEIGEVWDSIRGQKLYSGQPRSVQSEQTITRALMALNVATQANDRAMMAEASRLMAHTLNAAERYDESLEHYRKAIDLFEGQNAGEAAARTRLGYMAALYMTGRYDEAIRVADDASRWFRENNNFQGLAKIAANTGNLYYRREQHWTALKHHARARELFEKLQDWHGLAMTYLNLANCYSFTDQLPEAEDMYRLAEALSGRLEMQELLMQAQYNRSYLMFLQGRCSEALEYFAKVRQYFEKTGSARHVYLCDLDTAEIYLHLLHPAETVKLGQRAASGFEQLTMPYEQAKALAFCAMGLIQTGQHDLAERTVVESRGIFEREENRYWISVLDFCLAHLHLCRGDMIKARELAAQAKVRFDDLELRAGMVDSLKVLGSMALHSSDAQTASSCIGEVLKLTLNKRR
ncbi:MAG: tetratricopeptide repeat protein [Acidobacteria bacterium]|nr:tetratricopeptide repeat protein [Acidobacteriota bacterium]